MKNKRGKIVVNSVDDIRELAKGINLLSTGKVRPVVMDITELDENQNREMGEKLQELYSACGCEQGRTSGAFALVAYLAFIISGIIPMEKIGMQKTILYFVIFAAISMLLGKVYGIMKGRKAILNLADEIEQLLII